MNEVIPAKLNRKSQASRPPGPKGAPIMGVMREFNRDQLGFIERCARAYGDVVWMQFLYVPAIFLYHADEVEYVLVTNSKNFIKSFRRCH
jgi:cytochrome P450